MPFKNFLGDIAKKAKDSYDERQERKRLEKEKEEELARLGKEEVEELERQRSEHEAQVRQERQEYVSKVNGLLDKFEMNDLKSLCKDYLGELPTGDSVYGDDRPTRFLNPIRHDYIDYIWDNLNAKEIKFEQLQDFSLKHRIVAPSFFGSVLNVDEYQNEFENLINSIKSNFQPERITNEEHLQSQLTIFLKAKYPDRKIEREVTTKNGDLLDILVDEKYAFELKVPTDKTMMRNLSAQLEEYVEQYPNLCAIIFDNQNQNLTETIKEYTDRYKRNFHVPSIILEGVKQNKEFSDLKN